MEHLLGDIGSLSAILSTQRGQYVIEESGETIEADTPGQLLLSATMTSGAVLSLHVHSGKVTEPGTRIEISGTEGDLALVSAGAGSPYGELRLHGLLDTVRRSAETGTRQTVTPA